MKAWILIKKDGAQAFGLDLDEARRRAVDNRYILTFDEANSYSVEIAFEPEAQIDSRLLPPL